MSEKEELKPCPFCGKKYIYLTERQQIFFILCHSCGSRSQNFFNSEMAIQHWNTRAESRLVDMDKIAWPEKKVVCKDVWHVGRWGSGMSSPFAESCPQCHEVCGIDGIDMNEQWNEAVDACKQAVEKARKG